MSMQKKFAVQQVFTPTTPARLTFIEREKINNRLVSALRTPGKQIIIFGHSGSGKTTLLVNKLDQVYERHVITRCIFGMTYEQVIGDAFGSVGAFYENKLSTQKGETVSVSLASEYSALKASIQSESSDIYVSESKCIAPPGLTAQALGRFLGEAGYCWILEDFHKLENSEKHKLSQTMKVFMDMADEYDTLKVVAIGAVDTAREVVELDSEMRNRVSEILVPLMENTEIRQIIDRGENLINISIPNDVKSGIVGYSNGVASVCHQICLNICNVSDIYETLDERRAISEDSLENAVSLYMQEASDTFKSAFDKARRIRKKAKFDNVNLLLRALIELPQDGGTINEIKDAIKVWEPSFPDSNLRHFLAKLQSYERGEILRFDPASGKFSFSDPVYRVFAMTLFKRASDFSSTDQDSFEIAWNTVIEEATKALNSALIRRHLESPKEDVQSRQIELVFGRRKRNQDTH